MITKIFNHMDGIGSAQPPPQVMDDDDDSGTARGKV